MWAQKNSLNLIAIPLRALICALRKHVNCAFTKRTWKDNMFRFRPILAIVLCKFEIDKFAWKLLIFFLRSFAILVIIKKTWGLSKSCSLYNHLASFPSFPYINIPGYVISFRRKIIIKLDFSGEKNKIKMNNTNWYPNICDLLKYGKGGGISFMWKQ